MYAKNIRQSAKRDNRVAHSRRKARDKNVAAKRAAFFLPK